MVSSPWKQGCVLLVVCMSLRSMVPESLDREDHLQTQNLCGFEVHLSYLKSLHVSKYCKDLASAIITGVGERADGKEIWD